MHRSMLNKKTVLALGLALVLAAGGLATASNMGFKFVKSFSSVEPNVNTLSLPYFQSQFTDGASLFNDIGGTASRVCTIFPNYPANQCWNGPGGAIFTITPQNGLLVGVTAATTQVLVGSHDPALALSLSNVEPNINFKSIPYHTTYTMGHEIFNDIPGCTRVCHIFPNYPANECWNGPGGAIFSITIGDAYVIGVSAATTWTPDHY